MKYFDFHKNEFTEIDNLPKTDSAKAKFFVVCQPSDVKVLQAKLGFHDSTVEECTNIEDKVRHSSFKGYDFLSISYPDSKKENISFCEVNIYVSKTFLILVLPNEKGQNLEIFLDLVMESVKENTKNTVDSSQIISKIFFTIFDVLLTDILDIMEELEDHMHNCHDHLILKAEDKHFAEISNYRKVTYMLKKRVRAMSILGAKILVNHNKILSEEYIPHFVNADKRLKNLLYFAESLNELANELLSSYESKLSAKTNAAINKLTILTILFAPLTLITGIYGMNFQNMPELQWRIGYPLALVMMAVISCTILIIFKRKKWL